MEGRRVRNSRLFSHTNQVLILSGLCKIEKETEVRGELQRHLGYICGDVLFVLYYSDILFVC